MRRRARSPDGLGHYSNISTFVVVKSLARPDLLVEIEAIAVLGG